MGRLFSNILRFVRELRRRKVLRTAAVYAGFAFVLLQLAEILVPPFGVPLWTIRLITLLLVLGFPLALALAWVYDVTEHGIVQTMEERAPSDENGEVSGTSTSTSLIILVLIVVIGGGLASYPWWPPLIGPEAERVRGAPDEPVGSASERPLQGADAALDHSIAVLPFDTFGQEETGVIAGGLHDALLTRLQNVAELNVIARTSVEQYRGTETPIPEIARELNVRWVMEGSVNKAGNEIRVHAQLIDPRTDTHAWAKSYRRDLSAEGLFEIQDTLTRGIARSLKAELNPDRDERLGAPPTEDLKAYRLSVRGRNHLRARSEAELREGGALFRRALERDSTYARAWAGLADAWSLMAFYGFAAPDSVRDRALSAARRAVDLRPELAEAHASLGFIHQNLRQDGPDALRRLRRAVQLEPGYAQARKWLGLLQLALGRPEAGREQLARARRLDPLSPSLLAVRSVAATMRGAPERGLASAKRAVDLAPGYASARLVEGLALLKTDRPVEGREVLRTGLDASSPGSAPRPAFLGWPVAASVRAGETAAARASLDRLQKEGGPPFARGLAHAALGRPDAAARALEQAHWGLFDSMMLRYDSVFQPLRPDARYRELLRELNRAWDLAPDGGLPTSDPGGRPVDDA